MQKKRVVFHVVSIFPQMVENYVSESILKRAKASGFLDFKFYNLRDFTEDKHGKVDDKPYGGGPGMIMTLQPILNCVEKIKNELDKKAKVKIFEFVPGGKIWTNTEAKKYSKKFTDIILICGRYEGIDYRMGKILKTEKISVGDFVLTGGEIPAMILIDTIARQIKGVLGNFNSLEEKRIDVLGNEILADEEFYSRPEIFVYKNKKYKVPEVFLSGNPKLIREYKVKNK